MSLTWIILGNDIGNHAIRQPMRKQVLQIQHFVGGQTGSRQCKGVLQQEMSEIPIFLLCTSVQPLPRPPCRKLSPKIIMIAEWWPVIPLAQFRYSTFQSVIVTDVDISQSACATHGLVCLFPATVLYVQNEQMSPKGTVQANQIGQT